MLPDIQPGNTKILYFFNCLLDGMHTTLLRKSELFSSRCRVIMDKTIMKNLYRR